MWNTPEDGSVLYVAWYASPYWYGHESIDKAPWFSFGMSPSTVDVAFRTQKWSWDSIVSRQFFGALASAKSCAISCDDDSYNRIGDVWWYKQSRVGGLWLSLHEFTRLILQQTESAGCYCRWFFCCRQPTLQMRVYSRKPSWEQLVSLSNSLAGASAPHSVCCFNEQMARESFFPQSISRCHICLHVYMIIYV